MNVLVNKSKSGYIKTGLNLVGQNYLFIQVFVYNLYVHVKSLDKLTFKYLISFTFLGFDQ